MHFLRKKLIPFIQTHKVIGFIFVYGMEISVHWLRKFGLLVTSGNLRSIYAYLNLLRPDQRRTTFCALLNLTFWIIYPAWYPA